MAEDIRAKITIAVSNENATQELAKVEAAIKRVTDARRKDMEIARNGTSGNVSALPIVNNHKPPYPGKPADTRPGFNLISPEQNREIERATTNLKDFNNQRLKQLQIQQQINTANTAGNAAQKALRELEGYNDLLSKMENRLAKMKTGTSQYRKQVADIERVKASIQALNDEYLKEAIAAERAKQAIGKLGEGKRDLVKHTLAAKSASVLFHSKLGHSIKQMAGMSLRIAAIMATLKVVKFMYREIMTRDSTDLANALQLEFDSRRGALELQREFNKEKISAVDVMINASKKDKSAMSPDEIVELSMAVDKLRTSFKNLGIDIDKAAGNTIELVKAKAKLESKQIEDQKRRIRGELKTIEEQISVQKKIKEDSEAIRLNNLFGFATAGYAQEATRKIAEKEKEREEFQKQLIELNRKNPTETAERLAAAIRDQEIMGYDTLRKSLEDKYYWDAPGAKEDRDYARELKRLDDRLKHVNKFLSQFNGIVDIGDASTWREVEDSIKIRDALEDYLQVLKDTRGLQIEKAFASAFKSIASEIGKFQVTAQAAFDANSVEGMRLESRRFINNFQLPKDETLAHVKTIGADLKQAVAYLRGLNTSSLNTARYTLNLQNNITGTTTYA